jgi:putative peptidoglycan lipid II flippase
MGEFSPQQPPEPSVARSAATMSAATLLSRITGFFRTWACAFAIGNTLLASTYQVANNIPNMIYELVAGGILTTAFLPVYISQLKNRGEGAASSYASNLLSLGVVVLGTVALLATVFAPQVVFSQTFLTAGEDTQMALYFFRFFAVQIVFYGVGAIIGGLLNSHRKFLWNSLGPVFNNVVVIVTMFGYVPLSAWDKDFALVWLAVGTTLGVVAMFAVLLPQLRKLRLGLRFRIDLKDPALRETLRLAVPATVFIVVNLVVVTVRNACSLSVSDAGPASISYAWLWYQFPYGVLAVALSTAMLTEMSESAATQSWATFRINVRQGLSSTLFLIMPLAALMLCLAEPLTALYHAGAFTADDIAKVSDILFYWCFSLPFYAGYMFLYRAFSAMRDLALVTKIDACCRVGQAFLYALLTTGLGLFDGMGLVGIPIADAVFYTVLFAVLCLVLRRKVGPYHLQEIALTFFKVLAASAVAAGTAFLLRGVLWGWQSIGPALLTLLCCGVAGLAAYYLVCRLLRVPDTKLVEGLAASVAGRLRRRK